MIDMSAFPGGTSSPEFKAWQASNPWSVIASGAPSSAAAPSSASGGSGGGNFTSFLTEGSVIPSGSAVKSITSQTVLPDWYTNYAMDVLAGQKALSAAPYQTYQGPRVAGFTPDQQSGFDAVRNTAGAYRGPLAVATGQTAGALGKSSFSTAQPYFAGAMGFNPAAAANPDFSRSRNLVGQSQGYDAVGAAQPYYSGAAGINPLNTADPSFRGAEGLIGQSQGYNPVGAASPYFDEAAGMNALGSAQPYFSGASDYALQSTRGSGLGAAMPWLQDASGNVANVDEYMNPYQDAVVSRIADIGTRNLRDNIMPALEGRYISSGQFQGSGQMTDTARAIRDISDDILGQQSLALQQGYGAAQQFKQGDLARYGQLGATAGDLASRDMTTLANAGRTLADIGIASGNLTAGHQNLLAGMGGTLGNLTAGQQASALSAANAMGNIGSQRGALAAGQQGALTNIGTNLGNLTQGRQQGALSAASQLAGMGQAEAGISQNQRDFLANLGTTAAGITGADTTRNLAAAQQLANLGGLAQQYGLNSGNALLQSGAQQQNLNQQNLSVAYEDFLRQQGYPQEQINQMLNTFKGIAPGVPTGSQEQGIVPSGVPATYKPSTASQIGSGLLGAAGIADLLKDVF